MKRKDSRLSFKPSGLTPLKRTTRVRLSDEGRREALSFKRTLIIA